jgi:ribosomal protein S18 acetylase RimI-like enzyme
MTVEQPKLNVHDATEADPSFLQRMLYEAANRPDRVWPTFDSSMREPRNIRFWKGFPRAGDIGVVSQDDDTPIGAAWIRHFSGVELRPIYDPDVPVLAIGVEEHYRGRGVGQLLMHELITRARIRGVQAIDLTTGSFNEAAVRLYHSYGFRDTSTSNGSIRMRLTLSA